MAAPMNKICQPSLQLFHLFTSSAIGCHHSGIMLNKAYVSNVFCKHKFLDPRRVINRKVGECVRFLQRTSRGSNSVIMRTDNYCRPDVAASFYSHKWNKHVHSVSSVNDCKSTCIGLTKGQCNCKFSTNVKDTSASSEDDSRLSKSGKRENIYTIPNLLTLSRIVMTPVIGYMVVNESYSLALGLFTVAGLTDLLDGYIARNFKNQMSAFGTALDPLADKILITVLTVTLTCADLLPYSLAGLIISRDILLVLMGFIIRYMSLPPPITFKRYFDATNPTAKLLPSALSKFNTCLQLSLVCFTLAAPVFDFVNHPALQCLWVATAVTTFGSGLDYLINRKAYVQYLDNAAKTKL